MEGTHCGRGLATESRDGRRCREGEEGVGLHRCGLALGLYCISKQIRG